MSVSESLDASELGIDRPTESGVLPHWDKKWSKQALLARWTELGGPFSRAVAHSYRQVPISEDDLLFHPEWIRQCCDEHYVLPRTYDPKEKLTFLENRVITLGRLRRFGGNDIAAGESKDSAYTVVAVIGIDQKTKHRWLLHVTRRRGLSMGEQFNLLSGVYDEWEWENCGVESNGIQIGIERHYEKEGIIPTAPIHTGAKQKTDEEIGIPSMASQFQAKLWHIPWGDDYSRERMKPVVDELKSYPMGKFSDIVMALYFAECMWQMAPKGGVQCGAVGY